MEVELEGRGLPRCTRIGLPQRGGRPWGGASDNNTRNPDLGYLLLRRLRPSHALRSSVAHSSNRRRLVITGFTSSCRAS